MVKRYEPYFTDTPAFDSEPELVETGVSATLHYDPVNRPIRTDLPDGTFTKVEFTPWIQSTWDANDTVLQSDWYKTRQNSTDPAQKRAAQLAAAHANTPSVAHLDTLGRVALTITQSDATTTHTTRNTLDLEGNLLRQDVSRDASTTLTVLTQTFDILGRVCMARHPDSGAKLIWRDVASQTLRSWDSPDTPDERSQSFTFDALRRPTERWVRLRSPNGDISNLVEVSTYGESLTDAKARNARGQAYSHKDGAGIATDEQRDFQGKVTKSVRQLTTSTTKDVPDWSKSVTLDETFTTLTAYDALGRVIQIDTPHNQSVPASQVYPIYNEANLLDRVEASLRGATTRTTFVQNIDYDAKGQRQRITYGNGATTRYQYDPLTWRLTNLLTTRNSGTDTLQNLSYTYDPTGNVVQISDDAQQTVFFNNQVVTATALYEYDALYRLTQSTGREHINNGAATEPEAEGFNTPQNLPSDGQSLRNYTRSWTYDHVGNILSLIHTATGGNWTRNYAYATDSNRLATTTVGSVTQTYTHNAHGSFTAMPHLDAMDWTADERLLHVKRGTSQTWYTYDSTGQRVRKHTEKGSLTEERLYLGGWEIYRKRQGTTVVLERETLHLMDGARRIAIVETKTVDSSSTSAPPATVTRYQLDNHLQSATLELDETASIISYEEYYPYGDTSYRSSKSGIEVSEKRYRYTGKEKDEETGLYYHGARYYAAWLGRWTAADPSGMVDGACLYAYVRNHPTGLVDPNGKEAVDWKASLSWDQRAALWLDDKIQASPVARGIVNNLDKRGQALYAAPGAIAETLREQGVKGLVRGVAQGTAHLVADTYQAAQDVGELAAKAYYEGDSAALEQAASRGLDIVLNVADLGSMAGGLGAAKNAAIQSGKVFAATAKNAASIMEGGTLAYQTSAGVVRVGEGALAATPSLLPIADDLAVAGASMMVPLKNPASPSSAVPAESAHLQPYGGKGGGHHLPAKSAFKGAKGYDANKALAIPNEELARLGLNHGIISGAQQTLYKAFAKTGKAITWEVTSEIEIKSLVAAGMDESSAAATVTKAIDALKKSGVTSPTRIPWGG